MLVCETDDLGGSPGPRLVGDHLVDVRSHLVHRVGWDSPDSDIRASVNLIRVPLVDVALPVMLVIEAVAIGIPGAES
jgi:hypothetical protein